MADFVVTLLWCIALAAFAARFFGGFAVCYRNLIIFHILRFKPKKSATDFVVLCNLFSNGIYGIQMFISITVQVLYNKVEHFPW